MRSVIAILIALAALLAPVAQAQVLSVETYVEEWDEAQQEWVRVEDVQSGNEEGAYRLASFAAPVRPAIEQPAMASYGPFRVIDQDHAELVGLTGRSSPAHFAALLRDHPGINTLTMVEAPGTDDDRANLQVGRMIRAAGITTHVPDGGSVRSGAVELFLAGAERRIDDGAEFAVHSWIDINGRQPSDFAADSRENRTYLDYYREMGMTPEQARAFYDMTNSVGFDGAKWLTAQDMRGWLGQVESEHVTVKAPHIEVASHIAYLDSGALLP